MYEPQAADPEFDAERWAAAFDPQAWKNAIDGPSGDVETMTWLRAAWLPPDHVISPGVTAGSWVEFLSRPETPPGATYSIERYGTAGAGGRPLTLYLYGRQDPSERRPGVVFIHGGGWQNLHPFLHIRHANALAARGYVTATISYRLFPEGTVEDAVADAKCAVRWMRANAERTGLDASRLAVAGGSAGGHLAAMIATTPGRFEGTGGHGDESSAAHAAVLWYPVTDLLVPGATFEGFEAGVRTVSGTDDVSELRRLSPVSQVTPATPPTLTLAGDQDELTAPVMLRQYHVELDRHGVENELRLFEGKAHAWDLAPPEWEETFPIVVDFLDRHLA